MKPNTDQVLWREFRQGNQLALDQIFEQHVRHLHDYGYRLSSDYHLTKDCIQDLFVTLWSSRGNLGECDNIKFYLMKSLRRCIVKAIEKNSRLGIRERITEDFDFQIEFSHEFKLINNEISKNRKEQLQSALDLLSRRQKEVIYHKYYHQLSNQEIAQVMGLSIQGVYNLSSKAVEMLTQHIQEKKKATNP